MSKRRISARLGGLAAATVSLAACTGCSTAQQFGGLGPQIFFGLVESFLLDTFVTPTVIANAGPSQAILTNQRIVLSGRGSSLQTGSGGGQPLPTDAAFAWQFTSTPLLDSAGNPVTDPAQLALSGIRLDSAGTSSPQFISPVAGDFVIQLTVNANVNGTAITGSDVVGISVSVPQP